MTRSELILLGVAGVAIWYATRKMGNGSDGQSVGDWTANQIGDFVGTTLTRIAQGTKEALEGTIKTIGEAQAPATDALCAILGGCSEADHKVVYYFRDSFGQVFGPLSKEQARMMQQQDPAGRVTVRGA